MIKNNIINITQIITKEKTPAIGPAHTKLILNSAFYLNIKPRPIYSKNFLKSYLITTKTTQRVYIDGSKTREGVGFLIIFPKEKFYTNYL